MQCRHKIDNNERSSTEILKTYTNYIHQLLQKSQQIANQINNKEMRSQAVAISAIFNQTEVMGLQRALGTMIIQGAYTPENTEKFIFLKAKEEFYQSLFQNYASKEQRETFQKLFLNKEIHKSCIYCTQKVIDSIILKEPLVKLNSALFFTKMSTNIANLNHFIDTTLQQFSHTAKELKENLKKLIILLFTSLLILVVLSVYLYRKIESSISQPLQSFTKAIKTLEKSKDVFYQFESNNKENLGFLLQLYHELKFQFLKSDTKAIFQTQKNNLLQNIADIDPLTSVYNRRKFNALLEAEFIRSKRYKHTFSLLMLDIDHFKKVNDSYGHDVGDVVLQEYVKICQSLLRSSDSFARLGGEEFAILMPETSQKDALIYAQRVLETISTQEIVVDDKVLKITTSIGVAQFSIEDDITPFQTLKNADKALYKAKESGRNRVCVESE